MTHAKKQKPGALQLDALTIQWKDDPQDPGRAGCLASACVSYRLADGNRRLEWLTSGGLWGIESPMSDDYRTEVEGEQLDDLRHPEWATLRGHAQKGQA